MNHPRLSPKQCRVISLIAQGYTNVDIALLMDISPLTVAEYVTISCDKLGALNRANAVAIALGQGVVRNPYGQ